MIVQTAIIKAKPGKEKEVEKVCMAMFPHVQQKEPNALVYNFHQSENNSGTFLFFEKYTDMQALEWHTTTPHFQEFLKNLDGLLSEPSVVAVWKELGAIQR